MGICNTCGKNVLVIDGSLSKHRPRPNGVYAKTPNKQRKRIWCQGREAAYIR